MDAATPALRHLLLATPLRCRCLIRHYAIFDTTLPLLMLFSLIFATPRHYYAGDEAQQPRRLLSPCRHATLRRHVTPLPLMLSFTL